MQKTQSHHDITLEAAQQLLQVGLEYAAQKHFHLAIAIVNSSGHLITFARMNDAALVTTDVACGKAKTAAYLKAPSKLFEDFVNQGTPSMLATPNILPLQGGVPLVHDGQIVGAVGVSGADGENDNRTAEWIAAAFGQ